MRTTIKVEMFESSPDEMTALANKVLEHDTELGADSPLKDADVTALKAKTEAGAAKRNQAKKLHAQAESLNQQGLNDIGLGKGQDSRTAGTVYNLLASVRDALLLAYKGEEEKLSEWGFKVTIGNASSGKKSATK